MIKTKAAAASAPNPQELQGKDKEKFTELIRLYEQRRCRKGIKLADQILKKYPTHGETMSLKAIHLYQLGRHAECHDLLKQGLRANMSSHMSWHVNALVAKGDHRWHDALRYLTMALKFGTSRNVLKDLVTTHAMIGGEAEATMGDNYIGFAEAGLTRLREDPKLTANWMTVIAGLHAAGDSKSALVALDAFMEATGESVLGTEAGKSITLAGMSRYERSETLLLRNTLVGGAADPGGKAEAQLANLDEIDAEVTDRTSFCLAKAALLVGLGRSEEAVPIYRSLLDGNAESKAAWDGLRVAIGVKGDAPANDAEREKLLALYDEYAAKSPLPSAPRTQALLISQGEDFERRLRLHAGDFVSRGIPSFMSTIKALYPGRGTDRTTSVSLAKLSDQVNRNGGVSDEESVAGNAGKLAVINALPTSGNDPRCDVVGKVLEDLVKEHEKGDPRSAGFARAFLATHLSWTGHHERAVQEAQRAVDILENPAGADEEATKKLVPFLIDAMIIQAKVLKRTGDFAAAAAAAERARLMDLQDRFINTLAAKHHLRAGSFSHGAEVARAFTKDGIAGNNLSDMHAMWYECHVARCHRFSEHPPRPAEALVKHLVTLKHVESLVADTTDFHDFCMGKRSVRAWFDQQLALPRHAGYRFLFDAAVGAAAACVDLSDRASKPNAHLGLDDDELDLLDPSERKKVVSKAKKAAAKKAAAEEAAGAADKAGAGPSETQSSTFIGDSKYESTLDANALERSGGELLTVTVKPFLDVLWRTARDRVETHAAWGDVHIRTGKPLLVARALVHAARVCVGGDDATSTPGGIGHPVVFGLLISFLVALGEEGSPCNAALARIGDAGKRVLSASLGSLVGVKSSGDFPDPVALVASYAEKHAVPKGSSLECRVAAACAAWAVNPNDKNPVSWLGADCVKEGSTVVGHERLAKAVWDIGRAAVPMRGRKHGSPVAEAFVPEFRKACATVYPKSAVFSA